MNSSIKLLEEGKTLKPDEVINTFWIFMKFDKRVFNLFSFCVTCLNAFCQYALIELLTKQKKGFRYYIIVSFPFRFLKAIGRFSLSISSGGDKSQQFNTIIRVDCENEDVCDFEYYQTVKFLEKQAVRWKVDLVVKLSINEKKWKKSQLTCFPLFSL